MPDAHASLAPSAADRWLRCPPSAKLNTGVKREPTPNTEEGTAAHALAEWQLKKTLFKSRKRRPTSEYEDEAMRDYVEAYVAYVMERANDGKPFVAVEERLDLTSWVPDSFGTADCLIAGDGKLHVIDLKYGQGVKVAVSGNPQLRLYALAALEIVELFEDIETVETTIFQPRLDNVSSETISRDELLAWGEQIKPTALLAFDGGGELAAGPWCRWCAVKAECRARAEANLEVAKKAFGADLDNPNPLLGVDEIAELYPKLDDLAAWVRDLKERAESMAIDEHIQFPGLKIVRGLSRRQWLDEAQVQSVLEAAEVKEIFTAPKLKTITAIEKMLGKKQFTELLGELVHKPEGKPVLVSEDDKRPAIDAITLFEEDIER